MNVNTCSAVSRFVLEHRIGKMSTKRDKWIPIKL